MADWQGKHPKNKRTSEHKSPDELKRDGGDKTPPRRETWNREPDRHKKGGGKRTEVWNTHSDVNVNWKKFFQRAKIIAASLLTLLLFAWFAWLILGVSDKTHLTLVTPAIVSKNWLSTTPYANSLKRQFENLDRNNRYLVTDSVSLEEAWESFADGRLVRFGGPDGTLAVVYLCIVGIVADRDNDQRLEAYALPADASPFDRNVPDSTARNDDASRGAHPLYRFPLSQLIDSICEYQEREKTRKDVMLVIDSQKLELPTNLGLMHDRFAEIVRKTYLEKMAARTAAIRDKHEFVLLLSHQPGQTNWPAPEFGSSIFGRFAQLAFSGFADGCTSDVQDGVVDLEEFQCYLTSTVKSYASLKRNAKQVPMFLTSAPVESAVAVSSDEIQAVNFSVTNAARDNQFNAGHTDNLAILVEKIDIDQSWTRFFAISDHVVERNPLTAARCLAVLARMEQLLIYGHESDELSELQDECGQIIGQLQNIEQEESEFAPVSISEARLISEKSKTKLLPDDKDRFLEKVWDVYQKFGPLDLPVANAEVALQPTNESNKSDAGSQSDNVPAESAESTEKKPDAEPAEKPTEVAAAGVGDEEAEKKKSIQPYIHSLKFASNEKPWLLPWIVWEGFATRSAGDSITKKDLEYWLGKLGQDDARIDNELTKGQILEIKFLHLLNESVDWSVEDQDQVQKCVHLAVRTRYLSEKFAVETDNRVLRWFEQEFEDLDNQRRLAEDWLYANQFEMARTEFESVIGKLQGLPLRAQEVTQAFKLRDEVARDVPHYGALIGRLLLRIQQTDSQNEANQENSEWQFFNNIGVMRKKWVDMVIDNQALGRELTAPMIEPDLTVESSSRSLSAIKKLVDKLESEDGFLKTAKKALSNDTNKINDREGGLRIGTMMYIADLLRCPVIDGDHRKTLRARYLDNLPTDELEAELAGNPVLREFPDFDPEPSEEFKLLVDPKSAQLEKLPDNQQALAKLALAEVWEDSLIRIGNENAESANSIVDINASDDFYPIDNVLGRTGKVPSRGELPKLHRDLRNSDHLLRSVSSTIAEQLVPRRNKDDSTTYLLDGNGNTYKNRLLKVSTDLNRIDKSLVFESRVKRIVGDCWGNNRIRDDSDPYFAVLARIAQKRIPEDYSPAITEWLNTVEILPRMQAVRDFSISTGRYQYREDENKKDRLPHEFTIVANAAKTGLNGILAVQQQHQSSPGLVEPIPFEVADRDGGPENLKRQRRFAIPLNEIEASDSELARQYFFDEEITFEKHDDLDLVLSYRGHLVAKKFEIDRIPRDPLPEEVKVIGLRYDPEPLNQPVIRIDGDTYAKTDVVFVLDCSYSMTALFDLGITEGENSNTQMKRFDFLKLTLEETLVDMRHADAFSVGVVAIGSRAKYRQGSNDIVYSRQSRQFQREGVRPENDAYRLFDITDISDDSEFGELLGAISGLEPWGQTPLIDGIAEAHRMLQRRDSGNAKVIAVISDGVDEKTSKPSGMYPTAKLLGEYDQLEAGIHADSIKFHFLGFDMTNSEVTRDQILRLGETDFQQRFNRIKSFAGANFHTPKDGAELKDSLRRINDDGITRYRVYRPDSDSESELRDLNKPQDLKIDFDQPGYWNVGMTGSDQLRKTIRKIRLEGSEFVRMQFRSNELTFVPRDFQSGEQNPTSGGMGEYEVVRLPAGRGHVRFAFQKIGLTEFSTRPRRLYLQIATADGQPLFAIQDYKFISTNAYWFPVAEFRIPDLARGNYNLILKILPPGRFDIAKPVGEFELPFDREVVLNGKNLQIQGTEDPDSARVVVKGVGADFDDPDSLQDVLIDYGTSPADERSMTNRIPTIREFAENGKFIRHIFDVSSESGEDSRKLTIYQASVLFDPSRGAEEITFDFTVDR